ncbi:MAG: hypothetical protein ACREA2_02630 [Blastocatellia bacterium]
MSKVKTQAAQAAHTTNLTNAAVQPKADAGNNSTHAAEVIISLRRILAITPTLDADALDVALIEYEAKHALKAAEGFSDLAIVV